MEISNIPALLRRAFAEAGNKASIPLTSVSASRASFDVGFPALNMTPLSSGGVPPDGRDMNGILYAISQAALWAQAMGVMPWDTAFASAEGYPNGALVQHSGAIWRSKANNNAVAPSAASVAWERVSAEGGTKGQALVKASNKNGDWSWKALEISDIQGLQATIDNNKVTFSDAAPAMDGTATAGTSTAAARADHVHPTDTTRAAAVHGHAIADVSGLQAALDSSVVYGLFYKTDPTTVAFTKTGNGTASIKAGTKVDVAGTVVTFVAATAITMPALTVGTDYAIWVKDDATIQATTNFSSAPGAGNWRKIGGFHYAPGGNAAAQAGGDTTPAINEYSFWDLKFRPACPDPRGMTLVADSFWSDIYLLGVDHLTNGTSKYNVSIANGSAPPKIPTKFGGTGSNTYSTLNWWEANEVLQSWGKRPPTYDEFAALAYGTTEATSSGGSDVPTTGVSGTGATKAWNTFTSRWGVIQATGCMWIWGGEFGGGAAGASWTANTGGRGSTYQMENAVRLGGSWSNNTSSGSRCSFWDYSPADSRNSVGARGVANHLILD